MGQATGAARAQPIISIRHSYTLAMEKNLVGLTHQVHQGQYERRTSTPDLQTISNADTLSGQKITTS